MDIFAMADYNDDQTESRGVVMRLRHEGIPLKEEAT